MSVTIIKKQGGNIAISVATSPELEAVSSVNEAVGTNTEVPPVATVCSVLVAASPEASTAPEASTETVAPPDTAALVTSEAIQLTVIDAVPKLVLEPTSAHTETFEEVAKALSAQATDVINLISDGIPSPDKDSSFDFEKEAAIFSKKVAEAKTEQYKVSAIQAAVTKICSKSIKTLNKKADALTEIKISELFGNSCLIGSPEFNQKVFVQNNWQIFQETLTKVKLDFTASTEVQNQAIFLVEQGKFDFDDYYATAFSDALNKFRQAYESNDFNQKPFSIFKAEIYQQYLN